MKWRSQHISTIKIEILNNIKQSRPNGRVHSRWKQARPAARKWLRFLNVHSSDPPLSEMCEFFYFESDFALPCPLCISISCSPSANSPGANLEKAYSNHLNIKHLNNGFR